MMVFSKRSSRRRGSVRATRARRGFTLVEVMVAVVVLAIGVTGLAGMTVYIGKRTVQMATFTSRTSIETKRTNMLMAIPFDSLASKAGCTTVATGPFPYQECVNVTNVTGGSGYSQVQIIVTPANGRLRADTISFTRTKGVPESPLS
jgi:prepilin-type N-terminal cleavage/methylation domain-containing protein